MVMIEDGWWSPFLFDGSQYFSHLESQINSFAVEEIIKKEMSSVDPTSCTRTDGPDTACPDDDQ